MRRAPSGFRRIASTCARLKCPSSPARSITTMSASDCAIAAGSTFCS